MDRLTKWHEKHAVQMGAETRRNDIGWNRLAEMGDLAEQGDTGRIGGNKMINYNQNILTDGVHKIKVTIQSWDHIGHIYYYVNGNCKGLSVMDFDFEWTSPEEYENDCNLQFDESLETFSAELKNENGENLAIEYAEAEAMNKMIVAIEILDYHRAQEAAE